MTEEHSGISPRNEFEYVHLWGFLASSPKEKPCGTLFDLKVQLEARPYTSLLVVSATLKRLPAASQRR